MKTLLLTTLFSTTAFAQVGTMSLPRENGMRAGAAAAVAFNNELEGIYKIETKCAVPQANECKADRFDTLDRLTIVDTRRNLGVWVNFSDSSISHVIETFKYTEIGPSDHQIYGYPTLGTGFGNDIKFAYFEVDVDPVTADVSGYFIHLEDGSIYLFKGQKISVRRDLARPTPTSPVATEKILGTYHGNFGDHTGKFVLVQLPNGTLVGSYGSDNGHLGGSFVQFAYTMNTWDEATGSLRLVFLNRRFTTLGQLALNASEKNGKIELEGFQFTGFTSYPVKMTKVLSPMIPEPAIAVLARRRR